MKLEICCAPFELFGTIFFVLCSTLRVRNAHSTAPRHPLRNNNNALCATTDTATTTLTTQHCIMMLTLHDDQTGNEMVAELN